MNTHLEKARPESSLGTSSKRARVDDLLFNGARLGTTVQPAAWIPGTKYPRDAGE